MVTIMAMNWITTFIYPRRDLTITEKGSLQTLRWSNPDGIKSKVYAVIYNKDKGFYVVEGASAENGDILFSGFVLNEASTMTIISQ